MSGAMPTPCVARPALRCNTLRAIANVVLVSRSVGIV
jgi:hypothetical protein